MREEQKTEVKPELSWQQVEYVKHDKSSTWYIVFVLVFLVFGVLIFLATKSIFSLVVVAMAAVASLVYANKEPSKVTYEIFTDGFSINGRQYYFDEFKSFSPIAEKGMKGVIFNPVGRLQLPMYVYLDEKSSDEAFDIIEHSLVFDQYKPDLLQRIIDITRL